MKEEEENIFRKPKIIHWKISQDRFSLLYSPFWTKSTFIPLLKLKEFSKIKHYYESIDKLNEEDESTISDVNKITKMLNINLLKC